MVTPDIRTRAQWRKWLQVNHATTTVVWLVFHKKHTGVSNIPYHQAVEEALCFGWIDSIIKRLDEDRYVRKFTPRKSNSKWSEINKQRAEKMIQQNRMTDAGLKLIKEAKRCGMWARPVSRSDIPDDKLPPELEDAFSNHPLAEKQFDALASSYRRNYIMWIASAKKAETRQNRTREAVEKLERGETLGLK